MKELVLDGELARRFLLGELSPEVQGDIEEQAFLDADTFEFLEAAAEDLIDEFLSDDLSDDEKERFRAYFLSAPGRGTDLKIARALQQHVTQLPASVGAGKLDIEKTSWRDWLNFHVGPARLSLATVILVIALLTGIWLALRILRENRPVPIQVQKQTIEAPKPANQESEKPPVAIDSPTPKYIQTKPPLNQPGPPVYSFVLIPGGPVRGEDNVTRVKLPAASGTVRLELPLIGVSYRSYHATLIRDDGRPIRSWTKLKAKALSFGKGLELNVAAALLEQQHRYRILLSVTSSGGTVHEIGSYYFQVD